MNQSFQKFTLIFMQFYMGKKFKKINSKFGFEKRKPDFGFKTENRISGFRLTSLISFWLELVPRRRGVSQFPTFISIIHTILIINIFRNLHVHQIFDHLASLWKLCYIFGAVSQMLLL